MKKLLFLSVILLFLGTTNAQKVYSVKYESQADLKVYKVEKVRLAGKTVLKNSSCIKALG